MFDTQFSNKGRSVCRPAPTLIARMDKKPLYLASASCVDSKSKDAGLTPRNPTEALILKFMDEENISDVKIRMLKVSELKAIQGFPDDFELTGTKTQQLKSIGNSVVPLQAKKLVESNYKSVLEHYSIPAA